MLRSGAAIAALVTLQVVAAEWSPQLAASYLDSRQKTWFAWNTAHSSGGRCLSCHTGFPYLLARPVLRKVLGENQPTTYEEGLLDGVRQRLSKTTAQEFLPNRKETGNTGGVTATGARLPLAAEELGVESVFAAFLFATADEPRGSLGRHTEEAFERMWSLQLSTGPSKGAWRWNSINLDPWEQPESMFYGAALAALAVGTAPSGYQNRPGIQPNLQALKAYLKAHAPEQPLHNRLAQVWASTRLPSVLFESERKAILQDILRRQQSDGGWTMRSLGPWRDHPNAPESDGSNAYATAFVTFVLQRAGMSKLDENLGRGLEWLRTHQNIHQGFWDAPSMNKRYAPESVPIFFMRDAATAFATLSLIEAR